MRKRGRKAKAEDPKLKELERENARLKRRLARVETMLEIQKSLRASGDPPESRPVPKLGQPRYPQAPAYGPWPGRKHRH